MKKIFFFIFSIILIRRANADNIFDLSCNLGTIGIGGNYSADDDDNIELGVSLLNLTIERKDINIGLGFSPIKYWRFYKWQNETETTHNGEKLSFFNTNIYWDLIENDIIMLGPFASINYLFIDSNSGMNAKEYIFSGGLKFSFKPTNIIIISTEIGYRNIFRNNKLYFSVYTDLLLWIYAVGAGVVK